MGTEWNRRANDRLFDYLGSLDLADVLTGELDQEKGWEGWSDEELDEWIDGRLRERLDPAAYDRWRVFTTLVKRVRAGLPVSEGDFKRLAEPRPGEDS